MLLKPSTNFSVCLAVLSLFHAYEFFFLHCAMCSLLFTFCSVYVTFNNEILHRVDGIYKLNFAFIFFLLIKKSDLNCSYWFFLSSSLCLSAERMLGKEIL